MDGGSLQGLILAQKVILTKILGSGKKILSKIENIHQLKTTVKKYLSLNISLQVLSSYLFFTEQVDPKAASR